MTQRWHQSNERRIPLIQFVMYHLAWIFGLSFVFVVDEILVYLYYQNLAPSYSFLVPFYIVTGIAISNSLVCRSTALSIMFSWALFLAFVILYNIRLYDAEALTWMNVFTPLLVLFSFWVLVLIFIWVTYLRSLYHLKVL